LALERHEEELGVPLAEPLDSDRLSELGRSEGLVEPGMLGQEDLDALSQRLVDLPMASCPFSRRLVHEALLLLPIPVARLLTFAGAGCWARACVRDRLTIRP
jgi:hypothetical protein